MIGHLPFHTAVNIGIGISLALSVHSAAFAIYLAFVGYELLLYGALFVVSMVMRFTSNGYTLSMWSHA